MSHIPGIGPGSALAAVALAAFVAGTAGGETYYVAAGGDDAHAGTKTAPFRTIQRAVSVARAGDTVLVRAGVYKGPMPAPSSLVRGTGSSATTRSPSSATGQASSSGSPGTREAGGRPTA